MKNAGSTEKLSNSGSTSVASRVRSLFSSSPISRRKRAMSLDALSTVAGAGGNPPNPARVVGVPLADLVARDSMPVPFIIKKIVRHVEEYGLDQVGIYRINGNVKVIEKLRESFDKVGDANFDDEDIASVAGLLKLFLREVPEGVIPELLMKEFMTVQQTFPSEATPEALEALQRCLRFLPEPNYNTLRYLIRHMVKVAEHSEQNKMTAVSLSIVFGPNLFPCGTGYEGLRLQGFCNATVSRMILHHVVLFPRGKKWTGADPTKPRPYVEHMAEKSRSQESMRADLSATYDVSSSPYRRNPQEAADHDLSHTYSERSIDEAIYERTLGTMSPASPTHLLQDEDSNFQSTVHTSTEVSGSQALSLTPFTSSTAPTHSGGSVTSQDTVWTRQDRQGGEEEEEEGLGFQRRNAKRGMNFKPLKRTMSSPVHSTHSSEVQSLKHPQVASLTAPHVRASDEDHMTQQRTMSPASWQSSPGTTPPTSPALTPRGTRIFNSTIGATVNNLLFQPNVDEAKVHSARRDVYGLLLPEGKRNQSPLPNMVKVAQVPARQSISTDGSSTVSSPADNNNGPVYAVVKRRKKNPNGQRNRKSTLHEAISGSDSSRTVPLNETSVHLISVTSDNDLTNMQEVGGANSEGGSGASVESRLGKVSDLVKQFDTSNSGREPAVEQTVESEKVDDRDQDVGEREDGRKKISQSKLHMFEKTGFIMGMAGGPRKPSSSTSSGPSVAPSSSGGSSAFPSSVSSCLTRTSSALSESVGGEGSTASGGPSQRDKPAATSSTASDEEVFLSPSQSMDFTPAWPAGSSAHRGGLLSTVTSDEVFVTPKESLSSTTKTRSSVDSKNGGIVGAHIQEASTESTDMAEVAREGPSLEHPTLTRPKGPKSRKPPTRARIAGATQKNLPKSGPNEENHPSSSTTDNHASVIKDSHTSPTKESQASEIRDNHVSPLRDSLVRSPKKDGHVPTLPMKSSPPLPVSPRSAKVRRSLRGSRSSAADKEEYHDGKEVATGSLPHSSPSHQLRDKLLPRLDVVAQAPESKQAVSGVKKGWSELRSPEKTKEDLGVEKKKEGSVKELIRRIKELKTSVREYEADFMSMHGRKPSNHEKSPIRNKLIELSKLKKIYLELQATVNNEEHLNKTAPPEISRIVKDSPVRHTTDMPSSTLPLEPSKPKLKPLLTSPAKVTSSQEVGVADVSKESDGASLPLQQILNNIMQNLEARRKSAERPEQLQLMTEAQLAQEKHCIQKMLLIHEKQYGRPQSKSDKDIMRPLYDRYRAVKRACGKSSTTRESVTEEQPQQVESGLNTTETLPTVTMLQSSMTVGSGDLSKGSESGLLAEGGTPQPSAMPDPLKRVHREDRIRESHSMREKSRSSHRRHQSDSHRKLSGAHVTLQPQEHRLTHGSQPVDRRMESKARLLSEKEMQGCSHMELKMQKDLLLVHKTDLRKVLKRFETHFAEKYGRPVTKQDRYSMEKEYSQYKSIKGKLRLVEALLAKPEPHVTI